MSTIRIITWIVTAIFGFLFLINWVKALSVKTAYGSPGNSIPYILGLLIFWGIIPGIFWLITYFSEKNK